MTSRGPTAVGRTLAAALAGLLVWTSIALCPCAPRTQAKTCRSCCSTAPTAVARSSSCCGAARTPAPLASPVHVEHAVARSADVVGTVPAADGPATIVATCGGRRALSPPSVLRI